MTDRDATGAGYCVLLREPGVAPVVVASGLARLSRAGLPLSQLLLVHAATGSFALAGGAGAGSMLGSAALAPARGRWLDRRGVGEAILRLSVGYVVALVALVVLADRRVAATWLVAVCVLAGLLLPPHGPAMRAVWAHFAPRGDRRLRALSFDATQQQVLGLAAPPAAGLLAVIDPALPVLLCAGLAAAGSWLFVRQPVVRTLQVTPSRPRPDRARLPLRGIALVLMATASVGVCFGLLQVAVPAAADQRHAATAAGLLLACFAMGGAAGGIAFGRCAPRWPLTTVIAIALASTAGVLSPLPLILVPLVVAASLLAAGACAAPVPICSFVLIDHLFGAHRRVEGAAWLTTANNLGAALGNGLAGALIATQPIPATFAAAALVPLLAAGTVAAGRSTIPA